MLRNSKSIIQISDLVLKIQGGDNDASVLLVDMIHERLLKFCLLLCNNREIAEDLCQETLIKSLQGIHGLIRAETFLSWMYQIAKNTFIDLKRKPENKELPSEEYLSRLWVDANQEMIVNVQRVLSLFDPEDRLLLLLIELEGHSYREAGEILGHSEEAIRSKLHRLRASFVKFHGSEDAA